jgi:hypothetical protein
MNIKILSPKFTGLYIKYDSETRLSDYPDSVFSIGEFIDSELFTNQEKYDHLESIVNSGFYILKLVDAYLGFQRTGKKGEDNVFKLVRGIKALKKAADDPLGEEFHNLYFKARMNELQAMHPERYFLQSEIFDSFNQVFKNLDQDKRCVDYPEKIYEPSRVNFVYIINDSLRKFRADVELEIGDYLTGSVIFSNRMKKATLVVDPSVYEVLNGGFRKSSRGNEKFTITDEERVERVSRFCEDLMNFIEELKHILSNKIASPIYGDIDHPALLRISNMYPAFKKYRKILLDNKVIEIRDDEVWWNFERENRGGASCFSLFCKHIAENEKVNWVFLKKSFQFDTPSLAALKYRDPRNNQFWIKLKQILANA